MWPFAEPAGAVCRCICATAARTRPKTLSRFTPSVVRHCALVMLPMGASCGGHMPWFATRQSSRPNDAAAVSTSAAPSAAVARSCRRPRQSSGPPHSASSARACCFRGTVAEDDPRARLPEQPHGRRSNAARPARHQRPRAPPATWVTPASLLPNRSCTNATGFRRSGATVLRIEQRPQSSRSFSKVRGAISACLLPLRTRDLFAHFVEALTFFMPEYGDNFTASLQHGSPAPARGTLVLFSSNHTMRSPGQFRLSRVHRPGANVHAARAQASCPSALSRNHTPHAQDRAQGCTPSSFQKIVQPVRRGSETDDVRASRFGLQRYEHPAADGLVQYPVDQPVPLQRLFHTVQAQQVLACAFQAHGSYLTPAGSGTSREAPRRIACPFNVLAAFRYKMPS